MPSSVSCASSCRCLRLRRGVGEGARAQRRGFTGARRSRRRSAACAAAGACTGPRRCARPRCARRAALDRGGQRVVARRGRAALVVRTARARRCGAAPPRGPAASRPGVRRTARPRPIRASQRARLHGRGWGPAWGATRDQARVDRAGRAAAAVQRCWQLATPPPALTANARAHLPAHAPQRRSARAAYAHCVAPPPPGALSASSPNRRERAAALRSPRGLRKECG